MMVKFNRDGDKKKVSREVEETSKFQKGRVFRKGNFNNCRQFSYVLYEDRSTGDEFLKSLRSVKG